MTEKPEVITGMPGAARVEYYACREDVEAMIAQGYTARYIYDHMKKRGRVTCSYSAFCDYVRGGGKRQHSKNKKSTMPKAPQRTGQIIAEPRPNRFISPRELLDKPNI